MCIIAFKPLNRQFQRDVLEQCYKANSHGSGMAYIESGEVKIVKGMFEFPEFWEKVDEVQQRLQTPILCHFRVKSVGDIEPHNCHPFRIDAQHAMTHNGTLRPFAATNSKFSDTVRFVHHILKPMFEDSPNFYKTTYGRFILEEAIGARNKIAILDADGSCTILNESAGEWTEDGIWYSNKSYLPPAPKKKEQKYQYGKKRGAKALKPIAYRAKEDVLDVERDLCIVKNTILTSQEISRITHHYHCKLKELVYKGKVEPIYSGG